MTNMKDIRRSSKNVEPEEKKLPYNGQAAISGRLTFSFGSFDRTHPLFNLGNNTADKIVPSGWFIDFIDCLKSVSNINIQEVKSGMHQLHPIDWSKTNIPQIGKESQCEWWQFRINKSKGRIIGIIIDGVFYVVWLDPHHNLTDSEGYGGVQSYKPAYSLYEQREAEIERLSMENCRLKEELQAAEDLLNEASQ